MSGNILRNQKINLFRPMYSKQVFVIWTPFGLISVFLLAALLKLEITVSFLWLSLPVRSVSLTRIQYSELYSLAHTLLLNVFSALKGTQFYILFGQSMDRGYSSEPHHSDSSNYPKSMVLSKLRKIRLNLCKSHFFYMSRVVRKPAFCIYENKDADQLRGKLISAFVFATQIVQSLYFLNTKFQTSSYLLWLYRPVCVGSSRKPRRPVFSERGSYYRGVRVCLNCMSMLT